jgi:excisionase family DNA binding protein
MNPIEITNFEQIPQGLNYLIKRVALLEEAITKNIPPLPTSSRNISDDLYTRTETAKLLRVTLATLNEYTKTGKIIANRIGNRVLYRAKDVQAALTQIKTSKIAA